MQDFFTSFYAFYQLFLQLFYILTGNCSLLNLLSIALSFSLLDDDHFNSNTSPKKKKGQDKKPKGMTTYLISVLCSHFCWDGHRLLLMT